MSAPTLVLSQHFAEQYATDLRGIAPRATVVTHAANGTWSADAAAAEVVYLSSDMWRTPMARTVIAALALWPQLRWVHTSSAGVDSPAFAALLARGVTVTNAAGVNGGVIAQHVLALMLSHARRLAELANAQQQHEWRRLECAELAAARVVIVGLGGIGAEVARLCNAFGMTVCGVRRGADPVPHVDELIRPADLAGRLPLADYVVLACPLTAATRGLINETTLGQMKPSAYLVNVARGPVVDAGALDAALRAGVIAGAALDVFDREPLPEDSPLWSTPNLVISPHIAGSSPHNAERNARFFLRNLARFVDDQPLANVVRDLE